MQSVRRLVILPHGCITRAGTNTQEEEGLTQLKNKIKELFKLDKIKTNDFYYVSTLEQLQKIENCKQNITSIKEGIKNAAAGLFGIQ